MSTQATDLTIRKSITVGASPERAFETFTAGISTWWPFATHSIGGERTEAAVVEGHVGGRVYERMADGTEADWADILAWEPPHRLVLRWRVNPNSPHTEVEVRFAADGDGATRVALEHRGWEAFAEADAAAASGGYDSGWDTVLGAYVDALEARG